MILPKKQLSVSESFFGFGAFLLEKLKSPTSIDDLWQYYKASYANKKYIVKFSFDQYIVTLDYLYMIGAIKESEKGVVCNAIEEFTC